MAENLNYADSAKTPSLKGKSWCFGNDSLKCKVTGRLYTWAVAIDSVKTGCESGYGSICEIASVSSATLVQGICPTGWHLPSQSEWSALFTAVGGFGTAGKVLKSQIGWYSNGNGKDAFGFCALPAGFRGDGPSTQRVQGPSKEKSDPPVVFIFYKKRPTGLAGGSSYAGPALGY